ncbi:CRACD-like protein isoform X2 [Acipenser ruthenus]|uniref:CRACD-like protein isoform X2 n=1 Tax=Acipenser ruthenus TaxID=7906 RepID=UPI00274204AA|nr:CRACD-like protein isoform X2 [Acipenser ruthenus]
MAGLYSCLRGKNEFSIMASGLPDAGPRLEPMEKAEECPGKKKSKFQTFKNFFVKKKRKEPPAPDGESVLKQSRSSDNVSSPDQAEVLSDSEEYETGSKGSMGNKALSHDSVFVSDKPSSEANDGVVSSQENIPGKVKSLQFQLQQAIRMDSPLAVTPGKKCDDGGALSEDDGLPKSPPEISTLHTVLTGSTHRSSNPVQRHSSLSLEGTDSEDDEQAGTDASSSLASPLVSPDRAPLPADFSSPATPLACLDNSVAKHRIAVKHKACARRRPARRGVLGCLKPKSYTGKVLKKEDKQRYNTRIAEESTDQNKEEAGLVTQREDTEEQKLKETTSVQSQAAAQSRTSEETTASPIRHSEPPSTLGSSEQQQHHPSNPAPEWKDVSESCIPPPLESGPEVQEGSPAEPRVPANLCKSSIPHDLSSTLTCTQDISFGDGVTEAKCKPAEDEEPRSFSEEVPNSYEGPLSSACVLEPEAATLETDSSVEGTSTGALEESSESGSSNCEPSLSKLIDTEAHPTPEEQAEQKEALKKDPETKFDDNKDVAGATEDSAKADNEALSGLQIEEDLMLKDDTKTEAEPETEDTRRAKLASGEDDILVTEDSDSVQHSSIQSLQDNSPPSQPASESLPLTNPNLHKALAANSDEPFSKADQPAADACLKQDLKREQQTHFSVGQKQISSSASKARFTIAPAWQRSLSGGSQQKDTNFLSPIVPESFEEVKDSNNKCTDITMETSPAEKPEVPAVPDRGQVPSAHPVLKVHPSREAPSSDNPFGIRLRRTSALLKYSCESSAEPVAAALTAEPAVCSNEVVKAPQVDSTGSKPALPKKPEMSEENAVLCSKTSERTGGRSASPTWVTVAKQKQRVHQEHAISREPSLEETADRNPSAEKDDSLRQTPLPVSLSSGKNESTKLSCSTVTGSCSSEMSQHATLEQEEKRPSASSPGAPASTAEPPWLALAKKKAKAWSNMPQIVQ